MNIHPLLAGRTGGLKPSPIRKLNPLMRMPGMISLGGGYPNAQTFAFESLDVVFKSGRKFQIRDKAMDLACQYGPTGAHADLKPHIIKWHAAKDGVELKDEQIQVLNGAQEGLHTMAYLFLDQNDSVAQSIFLDLFGDPVVNPKGWAVRKFGSVGTLDRGVSKHRPRNAQELLGGQ